jgi:hypothetical protein
MRKGFLLVVPALLAAGAASARAQTAGCVAPAPAAGPVVQVTVMTASDTRCIDLSELVLKNPVKGWNLPSTRVTLSGATIDLRANLNPDPTVDFLFSTLNPSTTMTTYSVLFGLPIVRDYYATAISMSNLTVASTTGTSTVSPVAQRQPFVTGYGSLDNVLTDLGVGLGTAACTANGAPSSNTCDLGSKSTTFRPTYYNNLEAVVTYQQSSFLSIATFDGHVTINSAAAVTATPEPATLVLFGTGLAVLGAWTRRRRMATTG